MSVIIILIAISTLVAAGFLVMFLVASSNGQFDDDYTPALRIINEDKLIEDDER